MKLDFLFVYEHPEREIESIILLGSELKRRGYAVAYFRHSATNLIKDNCYFNKVRCVFVPFMYSNAELYDVVYRIVGKAEYIVNLQWEQILTKKNDSDKNSFWFPKDDAKNAIHLCWGERSKNNLLRAGVNNENAIVTGPIHLDYLRPEFKSYFMSREELYKKYGVQNSDKVVLFMSSFSYVNLPEIQVERIKRILGEEFYTRYRQYAILSQNEIVPWLLSLVEDGYTVIYRPHPSERLSECVEAAKKTERFYVIGEESVKQWIMCCDYLLTWISTSIVESYFLDIPCGILRPVEPLNLDDEVVLLEKSKKIKSKKELFELLSEDAVIEKNAMIENCYDFRNGEAYRRICDFCDHLMQNEESHFEWNEEFVKECAKKRKNELEINKRHIFMHDAYKLLMKHIDGKPKNRILEKFYNKYMYIEEINRVEEKVKNNALLKNFSSIESEIFEILEK